MAHTKAQGAANRIVNLPGRRLGLKRAAGQYVNSGTILLRQRGTVFYPGTNTSIGKDYTIFATENGYVSFRNMTGTKRGKKYIDVSELKKGAVAVKPAKVAKKATAKKKAPVAKKPVAKKAASKKAK